ncbi:MAG: tetratricopeptide repeat protein [Deltaproteobacteria bacterium]|nr:tetratricopeptide repeat protein [Deltaproteobacteria bacterium]
MTGEIKDPKQNALLKLLPYAALFLFSFLLYFKSLGFDFISSWDDYEYVINNTFIRGLTAENLKVISGRPFFGNYAPLHLLSYSLDYALWGLNPAGYHLSNIALHAANGALVYAVVKRITGRPVASFAAASLFAVHAINVENVAWVSERKTLLAAFFSFFALLSYLRFRERGSASSYLAALLLFVLALLSKPLTVTFPLVLSAYELFFKKGERRSLAIIPFFALSAAASVIAVYAHVSAGSVEGANLSLSMLFGAVYPTMLPIFWKYVGLIIWPFGLSGYYDTTVYNSFLTPVVAVSLAAWAAVFILVLRKGTRQTRFWFFWFWIWFLPVSNIVPIPVFYADRYMYLPAIAFFVMAGRVLEGLYLIRGGFAPARAAFYAVLAAIVIFYSAVSFNRLDVWRDELAFWEDTAKQSPGQFKARLNLGYAYEMKGRYEEAEREYLAAIAIYPAQEAMENLEMVRAKRRFSR